MNINLAIVFFDMSNSDFPNICEPTLELFRRQIGVLLQHKAKRKGYEICSKKSHEESYEQFKVNPIIPRIEVPTLIELLNQENFPEHDEIRFQLLKWMIDERKLRSHNLSGFPKNYFLDILTLVFLTSKGFISAKEADVIFLSIKYVENAKEPNQHLEAPEILNERAFFISVLFQWYHVFIARSLEIVGLKQSMTV
jgi:hypothetical protein